MSPTQTQDELDVLDASRSSNVFAINVYYIGHFLDNANQQTLDVNGRAYTNDTIPTITNKGVMVAVYGAPGGSPGGPLAQRSIISTLGHEIGHSLLNNFNNGGPGNIEHKGVGCGATDLNRFYLMHGTGCKTRKRLISLECTDMKTNGDESNFVEAF